MELTKTLKKLFTSDRPSVMQQQDAALAQYQELQQAQNKDAILKIEDLHKQRIDLHGGQKVDLAEISNKRDEYKKSRYGEVAKDLEKIISKDPATPAEKKAAWYLGKHFSKDIRNDPRVKQLADLLQANPDLAQALDMLISGGREVNENYQTLISVAMRVRFLTRRVTGEFAATVEECLEPIMAAIEDHVGDLVTAELQQDLEKAARSGRRLTKEAWLASKLRITEEEAKGLTTDHQIREKLKEQVQTALHMADTASADAESLSHLKQAERKPVEGAVLPPPREFTQKVEATWDKILDNVRMSKSENADGTASYRIDAKQWQAYDDELAGIVDAAFPKEHLAGSRDYMDRVRSLKKEVSARRMALSQLANEARKAEEGTIQVGKLTPEQFLKEFTRPGSFGEMLSQNEEILELLTGFTEKSARFRDQVFLRLHRNVLHMRRQSTQATFGLYERSDFTTFINIIGSSMTHRKDEKTGLSVGQHLSEHYTNLSDAIQLSRDIDYNASQPGADIRQFQKAAAMYQNEFAQEAFAIPAVAQAFRIYETSLRGIKDAHDGYIPPSLVEYDATGRTSVWDNMTKGMMRKLAVQGQLFDVERDKENGYLPVLDATGRHVKLDVSPESAQKMKDLVLNDDEELALDMYMTLAKGFGMVSARYLEIFSNSKVPGADQPVVGGISGFRSKAGYEGTAAAFNPIDNVFHKYHMGSYKYFHLMNTLLPDGKKFSVDPLESTKTYIAYRNGDLKKTNPDAVRLLDKWNLSDAGSSLNSAWRYLDMTIGWSDKDREKLGSSVRIFLADEIAKKKAEEVYLYADIKNEFRDTIIRPLNAKMRADGKPESDLIPETGPRFDAQFDQFRQRNPEFNKKVEARKLAIEDKTQGGKKLRKSTPENKRFNDLKSNYALAYKARAWVEMAMRNPLGVAHKVKVEVPGLTDKDTKTVALHDQIMQEILGHTPEDMQYSTVVEKVGEQVFIRSKGGKYAVPTEEQNTYLFDRMDLEADVAAVRELAIREQRDLTIDDFKKVISGDKAGIRQERALLYWRRVREAVMGNHDDAHATQKANELYEKFGLSYDSSSGVISDYSVDWKKVNNIQNVLGEKGKEHTTALAGTGSHLGTYVHEKWRELETDELSIDQLDMMGMGHRIWFRKTDDSGGQVEAMGTLTGVMDNHIKPFPDFDEMAKELKKAVQQLGGDDISKGYGAIGPFVEAIDKFYAWDISTGLSAAQVVWGGRMNAISNMPNERWQLLRTFQREDVLPPHGFSWDWDDAGGYTIEAIMKKNHIMEQYAIQMAITATALLTLLIVWESLKEKEEDQ